MSQSAERQRLAEDAARERNWKRLGPYLAERQWGTVREDYSADGELLGLLPARPRPQPRLSLGRGRPARLLRSPGAAVLRARAVERARSDPQGAPVRADRPGGQPRRGRQGALLLPRLHADAFLPAGALQVPAGASIPYARLVEENRRRARAEARVRARATPALFDGEPLLRRRRRVRQGVARTTC